MSHSYVHMPWKHRLQVPHVDEEEVVGKALVRPGGHLPPVIVDPRKHSPFGPTYSHNGSHGRHVPLPRQVSPFGQQLEPHTRSVGQAHTPPRQDSSAPHAFPHAPQLLSSVLRLTQVPPQMSGFVLGQMSVGRGGPPAPARVGLRSRGSNRTHVLAPGAQFSPDRQQTLPHVARPAGHDGRQPLVGSQTVDPALQHVWLPLSSLQQT
jgi:hypothetical protein